MGSRQYTLFDGADETAPSPTQEADDASGTLPAGRRVVLIEIPSDCTITCSGCGEERDQPHMWRECVEVLRRESDDLRAKLATAEADLAEVARVAGVDSPVHVDDVTATIAEMLGMKERAEAAEVALERVAFERGRVVRERDDALAAKASAEAETAATREALQRLVSASEPFAGSEVDVDATLDAARAALSATAGAAMLRELEAGRRFVERTNHDLSCASITCEPCDCGYEARLAEYDAARGAR